ncbi:MAG: hypothetical protein WCA04_07630 [Geobacteraceae bacterium]
MIVGQCTPLTLAIQERCVFLCPAKVTIVVCDLLVGAAEFLTINQERENDRFSF